MFPFTPPPVALEMTPDQVNELLMAMQAGVYLAGIAVAVLTAMLLAVILLMFRR